MKDVLATLDRWQLDVGTVRRLMYRSATPRERERWHAIWLLARGWSAAQVAEALERDAHTIGQWAKDLADKGPEGLAFEKTGGPPPPSMRRSRRR